MIPTDHNELHLLAGEYVLGLLDAEATQVVTHALPSHTALRRAVIFWEERLHGLSVLAKPADPPTHVWPGILAGITPAAAPKRASKDSFRSLLRWQLATAASLVLAGLLGFVALIRGVDLEHGHMVAVLHAPQSDQPAWVASAEGDRLILKPLGNTRPPKDHCYELWAITPDLPNPQAISFIPLSGKLEIENMRHAIKEGGTLAISIEPYDERPSQSPTGPVVFVGKWVATN